MSNHCHAPPGSGESSTTRRLRLWGSDQAKMSFPSRRIIVTLGAHYLVSILEGDHLAVLKYVTFT